MTRNRNMITALTAGMLPLALGAGIAISAMTNDAPYGHFSGTDAQKAIAFAERDAVNTDNRPTFDWVKNDAIAKGCLANADWPKDQIPTDSLVIRLDGSAHRVPFDQAWTDSHSLPNATYWIIGSCA